MNTSAKPGTPHAFILVLILATTAAFHTSSIDENHRWWGDFALYMMHAKNIATGMPYRDTGFVFNPDNPRFSPPAYPPVYPLMLAPLYKLLGLNLYVPKLLNLGLLQVSLVVFYRFFTDRISNRSTALVATAMLAYCPWFWQIRNLIVSDIPFLLLTLLALVIIDYLSWTKQRRSNYWLWSILLGVVIYASYGTRILGVILIPTLVAFDVLKTRSVRMGTLLAVCVFLFLHQLQEHYLGIDVYGSYSTIIAPLPDAQPAAGASRLMDIAWSIPENIITNTKLYSLKLLELWSNGISNVPRIMLTLVLSLLALAGFIRASLTKLSAIDLFAIFYVGALLVVPVFQGSRYLLPVMPAYFLYCCKGIEMLEARITGRGSRIPRVPVIVLLIVLVSHAFNYALVQDRTSYFGVADRESTELFDFIRNQTPQNSHIKFLRPRILALYTERHSSIFNMTIPVAELWKGFRQIGATHLLVYMGPDEWGPESGSEKLVDEMRTDLTKIFENQAFKLYKIDYHDRVIH